MSLKRLARLAASAGVTAGLAFGGLATVAATPADAATTTSTAFYDCTTPLAALSALGLPINLGSFRVPATLSFDTLDDALLANVPVPAGLPFTTTIDFSKVTNAGIAGLLPALLTQLSGVVTTTLGQAGLGALNPTVSSILGQAVNGSYTISSQLGSFVPTGSGTLPLPIPDSLNFGLLTGALGGLGFNCTLDRSSVTNPGGPGTGPAVTVVKQGAKIKAHAKKKGHKAVLKVKVKTSAGQKGVGQIVAKIKGQKAKAKTLANGKVKLVFSKLKKGKNKIKLSYLGNGYTNPAKKKLSVKIAR